MRSAPERSHSAADDRHGKVGAVVDHDRRPPLDAAQLPQLAEAAFHGPLGEWVLAAAPHTEADPVALLVTSLVGYGVAAGRGPHLWAGDARQSASVFAAIVADTPKANRGLSWAVTRRLLEVVDPDLTRRRVRTGLGNGLSLLETLHAADLAERRYGAEEPDADPGRVLVYEPGLTRSLGFAARASSELPLLIRSAWDGQPLEIGHGRHRVEEHHIGVVAHATVEQLAQRLSLTGGSVGFVNRFVYVLARRQRSLVDEGHVPPALVASHGRVLRGKLEIARRVELVGRSPAAERRWRAAYDAMAGDDPGGLLGIMVARAARHALRMSLVYALAAGSSRIERPHVEAALALWAYCRRSAAIIASCAPSASTDLAERLLAAIEAAGDEGLSLSEQLDVFGRNVPAGRLRAARRSLEEAGLATTRTERRGAGRPTSVTRRTRPGVAR
jgi:hypothetical protein